MKDESGIAHAGPRRVSQVLAGQVAMMLRRCAWCGCDLGGIPCLPDQDDQISHGICPPCLRQVAMESRTAKEENGTER